MITPVYGALVIEYTDDEEGSEAEERDSKLNEETEIPKVEDTATSGEPTPT